MEECIQVIPARLGNLTAPEEAERYTTLGGDKERGPVGASVGIS